MPQPLKTKHRKAFRGVLKGREMRSIGLTFGNFGIKALKSFRISSKQLEVLKKIILKKMKNKGNFWIKVFPHLPITSKPASVRMGKGKGTLKTWVFPVNAGRILFEFEGLSILQIKGITKTFRHQLSTPVKLISL